MSLADPFKDEIFARVRAGEPYAWIAASLGLSKGVVSGLVHRARKNGIELAPVVKPPRQRTPKPKAGPVVANARTGDGCKWINGDPRKSWSYCDAPRLELRAWCPTHYSRVYRPAKRDEAAT